jgi:hypothetical protein
MLRVGAAAGSGRFRPVQLGESRTGYVCWTINANGASSLVLFFGSGTLTLDSPRTTWFALH